MAQLKYTEKMLLENLLGMGGGWLLDFNNASYAAFFRDQGVEIDEKRFFKYGESKAKRMRAFWEIADDTTVGRVLQSLYEYIDEIDPEGAGGPVEDKHRAIAGRLLGIAPQQDSKNIPNENEFLRTDFGEIDVSKLLLDAAIENAIQQRLDEIQVCMKFGAPLAAVFLIGSTLEGLLLNMATNEPASYNRAAAAPKDKNGKVRQFQEWKLSDLINVSSEVRKIGEDVRKFSDALRDFRNYIHPFEQAQSRFDPDIHTAEISWQVLRAAIADLSGER